MTTDLQYDNRQPIPRWLLYQSFRGMGDGYRLQKHKPSEGEFRSLDSAQMNWRTNKTESFAVELLAASEIVAAGDNAEHREALLALETSIKSQPENPLLSKLLDISRSENLQEQTPSCLESPGSTAEASALIAASKKQLILYPHDAIAWIDLGYLYTIRGQPQKAERCVEVAYALSSGQRNIVRFASRFFIHVGDPERALFLVRDAAGIGVDPLLVSAEIAISGAFGLKSRYISEGRRLLELGSHSNAELSELRAALSTMEFWAGNDRKGKKLLKSALVDANENTLAQAEFIESKFGVPFDPSKYDTPCNFEALSWDRLGKAEYDQALVHAREWYLFQPFASRPAILSSYLAAVMFDDDKAALGDLEPALLISPHDPNLINNEVFSLSRLGKIVEAEKRLSAVRRQELQPGEAAVLTATTGLMHFRMNQPERGAKEYEAAINYFAERKDHIHHSRALYFYGMEMLGRDLTKGLELLNEAKAIALRNSVKDVLSLLEKHKALLKGGQKRI